MRKKFVTTGILVASSALVLAGCASGDAASTDDGTITVVASTNVYGDIAAAIGGDLIEVESIITSSAQDPHSYEASAQDQLTLTRADLVIENGGGYDAFIDQLLEASDADPEVLTAVEFSHDYPGDDGHDHADEEHDHADETHETEAADGHDHEGHDHIEGFNEHVWYDPHTIEHLAEEIAHELGELDPDNASTYQANYEEFAAGIAEIEASLDEVAAAHAGEQIFVTEPVPLYLTAAAGLENATPAAFSEAVEEGQDVPPATLLEAQRALDSGDVRAVIANAQTGGAETTQVVAWADAAGIPVLEFTELLPEGDTYLTWMQANVDDLTGTLTR